MAHAPEEVADMAGIASALVLNIGTLTTDFVEAMILGIGRRDHPTGELRRVGAHLLQRSVDEAG